MMSLFKLALSLLVLVPGIALAHGGGLDASGCHTCKTNCQDHGLETGQYHCHADGDRSIYTPVPSNDPEPEPEPAPISKSEPEVLLEQSVPEPLQLGDAPVVPESVATPEPQNEAESVEKPSSEVSGA